MDLEQIEKLVEIIEKSTLKEITVEEGNLKINLKREIIQKFRMFKKI